MTRRGGSNSQSGSLDAAMSGKGDRRRRAPPPPPPTTTTTTTTTAPRMCCRAFNANCLACAAGISEEEYCANNPGTPGCPEDEAAAVGDPHLTRADGVHRDLSEDDLELLQ